MLLETLLVLGVVGKACSASSCRRGEVDVCRSRELIERRRGNSPSPVDEHLNSTFRLTHDHFNSKQKRNADDKEESEEPAVKEPTPEPERDGAAFVSSAMGHIGSLASISSNLPHDFSITPVHPPDEIGRAALRFPPTIPVPPPITQNDIFRHGRHAARAGTDGRSPNQGSDASPTESFSDGRPPSDASGHRKKRRRESGHPADPETLAAASLRNPVDALDLLLAAADGSKRVEMPAPTREEGSSAGAHKTVSPHEHATQDTMGDIAIGPTSNGAVSARLHGVEERQQPAAAPAPAPKLEDFPLVKKGIMSTRKLCELVDTFCTSPFCPPALVVVRC